MVAIPKCYILYPVRDNDEAIRNEPLYYSSFDVIDTNFYVIDVVINGTPYQGTFYLTPYGLGCPSTTVEATIVDAGFATLYCYYVTAGSITYVDETDTLKNAAGPINICSKITPQVVVTSGTPVVQLNGECIDGVPCVNEACYFLTNCITGEIIQSKSTALATFFAQDKIVELTGKEGCWSITKAAQIEDCDCAISVTVSNSYTTCEECLPVIAYRITNCETNEVKFSEQDLSAYAGKTIKDADCGGCWSVEQINIKPPTSTTITITDTYKDCEVCLRKYWELTDCNGSTQPIITYTDMTAYTSQVIKLVNNPTCYFVNETELFEGAVEVNIFSGYSDCFTCGPLLDCNCIRITNDSSEVKTYQYEECNTPTTTSQVINSITLQPNESSDKMCIARFITVLTSTDLVVQYGACVENPVVVSGSQITPFFDFQDSPFTCPIVKSGRNVTPGYTVPACTIDKYEDVVCNAAEILYKKALSERYGIFNCCPDEDEKYLIKKELLDLASLRDKSITCTEVNECCANPYCN